MNPNNPMHADEQPTHAHESDPHPAGSKRLIGRAVSFDHATGGAAVARLVGIVEKARYIGRTARGQIPDYEITVRGSSGKLLTFSMVDAYTSFQETP